MFISSFSYAYWKYSDTQSLSDVVGTKCLQLTMHNETSGITITDAVPKSDEKGKSQDGYTFTIKNTCNTIAYYQINLEEIEESKRLEDNYIKVSLNESEGKLLSKYEEVNPTIKEENFTSDKSHKLTSDRLNPNEEKEYTLKLWMDEETPAIEEVMNATFESKVSIIAVSKEEEELENTITISYTEPEEYSKEIEEVEIHATSETYNLIEYSTDNKVWNSLEKEGTEETITQSYTKENTYPIYFKDEAGNIEEQEIETNKLDQTPPEISIEETNDDEGAVVNITFNDEKSGLYEYKIEDEVSRVDIEKGWTEITNESPKVIYKSQENKTIQIFIKDKVGNEKSKEYQIEKADITSPNITYKETDITKQEEYDWYQNLSLEATVTDNMSEIKSLKYCIATEESCEPDKEITLQGDTYKIKLESNEQAQKVCMKAIDNSVNENESPIICSNSYKVDTSEPIPKISASSKEGTITINGADSTDSESKIVKYEYSKDNTTWYTSTNGATTSTYSFNGYNDGTYTVYLRVTNGAGKTKVESTSVVVAYQNVYISSSGNDNTGDGSRAKPYFTLTKAYSRVGSGGNMILLSNITTSATANFNTSKKSVTLKSDGTNTFTITKASTLTTEIIVLNSTNTLTTNNVVYDGNNVSSTTPIISAKGTSILNLNSGVTVKGGNNTNTSTTCGGGVDIEGSSTLNMNGATITSNKAVNQGGGVHILVGTFNFNSGTISNNSITTLREGAGVFVWNGTMNMKGGTINGNTGAYTGGGVWVGNDASKISTFTMSSGTITKNSSSLHGGGIYISSDTANVKATATITGGTISSNTTGDNGGGIEIRGVGAILNYSNATVKDNTVTNGWGGGIGCVKASCTINSGYIQNNKAISDIGYGGGISADTSAKLELKGGTIQNNIAKYGGGITIASDTQFIMSGGTVQNNTANDNVGGINCDNSTCTFSGGTISGNSAVNTAGGLTIYGSNATATITNINITGNKALWGAGISVNELATLTMKGGTIQNNTATGNSGGVDVNNATFNLENGNIINNTSTGTEQAGGIGVCCGGKLNQTGGNVSGNSPKNTVIN